RDGAGTHPRPRRGRRGDRLPAGRRRLSGSGSPDAPQTSPFFRCTLGLRPIISTLPTGLLAFDRVTRARLRGGTEMKLSHPPTMPARCLALALFPGAAAPAAALEPLRPPAKASPAPEVARRLDAALEQARDKDTALPPLADDPTFLRRLSLDLTGKLPSADEAAVFLADSGTQRRAKLIDRLLSGEAYAVNWGRYWRDVRTYPPPARGNYLRWQLFDGWMTDQVRRNRPWGEVVAALVTATGINDESAPVNYLTAHFGNQVEVAATTSRVFLGVELQCAQCHDAKTEPWKREQFHEFVAFFGRAKLVQHKDVNGRGTPYAIEGREEGQYQMTDKKDPQRLIPMTPRFLTGESVALDNDDAA